MNKALTLVNRSINLGLVVFMFFKIIFEIEVMSFSKILTVISIIPILLVPFLIKKIIKYQMSEILKLIYYLFVIVALVLGSILGWYYQISWLDLLAHFLSGILTSLCALIILKKEELLKIEHISFTIVFIVGFTLMTAAGWEFFEFFSDKILNGDSQWVLETGVDDTMTDMLIAFLGSIGFSIYLLLRINLKGKEFLNSLNKVL